MRIIGAPIKSRANSMGHKKISLVWVSGGSKMDGQTKGGINGEEEQNAGR
jgi:hypothetical protein